MHLRIMVRRMRTPSQGGQAVSRGEAAAKANYEAVTGKPWENAGARAAKLCYEDSATIIAALDAHDAANNIHRLVIDDATVERAARALLAESGPYNSNWDDWSEHGQERWREAARAVLAAAVQEWEA